MELSDLDQALLGGDFGRAASKAMSLLVRYGEAVGASEFISITSAHIDGCLYHGPSSIDFAEAFSQLGGRILVPTTLNVAAVDVVHPGWNRGPPEVIEAQLHLTALYESLGCLATLTCAPYQRMIRPRLGEHVAWAESNAIVFANSVLGARTDRYGDFTDLCAALTGRVPLSGLHREEERRPQLVLRVPAWADTTLSTEVYFGCVGYVVGERSRGRVPYILGLPEDATEDSLKAVGSAAASSGSLALFHAAGITPEAGACDVSGIAVETITSDELSGAAGRLCPLEVGEPLAAVCLGTPHFSIAEFGALAHALDGRRKDPAVEIYVSTSREIEAAVSQSFQFAPLRSYDVKIVVDTCTYLAPVVRQLEGAIVTNSVKFAHYGPGNLRRRVGLMSLERCLRSADLGRVAP